MTVSARAILAINAPETSEAFIWLLTITHADLTPTIRLANNSRNIRSRGLVFTAFPFDVTLANDEQDRPPRISVSIINVSRTISASLEGLDGNPTVDLEMVMAATPNVLEASLPGFDLVGQRYNWLRFSGTLGLEDFLQEPYPDMRFSPSVTPGVHR